MRLPWVIKEGIMNQLLDIIKESLKNDSDTEISVPLSHSNDGIADNNRFLLDIVVETVKENLKGEEGEDSDSQGNNHLQKSFNRQYEYADWGIPHYNIYGDGGPRLSDFNYSEILKDTITSAENVQASIILFCKIFYEANAQPQKIIQAILPAIKNNNAYNYSDGEYKYHIKNQNDPVTGLRLVEWSRENGSEYGRCIFSFIKQIKPGIIHNNVVSFACKALVGSDCLKKETQFYQAPSNFIFLPDSKTYNRSESKLAETILKVIDEVAGERKQYTFKTDEGNLSFKLLKWSYKNQSIELFLTLQKDNQTGMIACEVIAPPPEYSIYDKHRIEADRTLEVHIHDDISNANDSETPQTIGTWCGDLSFAFHQDWSFLKGRIVKYLFDTQNPDSFEIGSTLRHKFKAMESKLELCEYSNYNRNKIIWVWLFCRKI